MTENYRNYCGTRHTIKPFTYSYLKHKKLIFLQSPKTTLKLTLFHPRVILSQTSAPKEHTPVAEQDYRKITDLPASTTFLKGTAIEIVRPITGAKNIQHVLFDFDGTLSLIREGWPEVMIPMMVEIIFSETGQKKAGIL